MPLGRWLREIVPPDPRAEGSEPDYRFTLANERTFLAWLRTSLAMAAGGLAAIHLLPDFAGRGAVGIFLLAMALVTAAAAYRRWANAEAAMRRQEPLPASRLPLLLAIGTAVLAVMAVVLIVADGWS